MLLRLSFYRFWLRIVTYLLPSAAFILAGYARFYVESPLWGEGSFDPYDYFNLLLFATLAWSIATERYHLTNPDELVREGFLLNWTRACTATYLVTFAAVFFYRAPVNFSRGFLLLTAPILLSLGWFTRKLFLWIVGIRRGSQRPISTLIVGADDFAREAAAELIANSFARCRVVGHVRLRSQVATCPGPLYEVDDLKLLNNRDDIENVVIALAPKDFSQIPELISHLSVTCLPVRLVLDLGKGVVAKEKLHEIGRLQVLNLEVNPLETLPYVVLKRLFDVCFASLVIVLSSPLMIAIAIAVRLTSPGPIMFVQDRVGLNGRVFRMYKFRTMRVTSEAESATRWTTENDPRRTRLGAFLRRTSLDELPQFFNVLQGNMSVVGPRPERPQFVHKFLTEVARYNRRHALKVGITGWAQVNGWRGDTSIERRVAHDLYYIHNWSLGLDLKIIVKTMASIVSDKNAY